jgi:hypothetical protein
LKARDLPEVLTIVRKLRSQGVPLWDDENGCRVWINQSAFGGGTPRLDDYFAHCGLVGHMTAEFERPLWWELPPSECQDPQTVQALST